MKTLKRELMHVGMFGADGTTVTKNDIAECAATFDGKCPIVIGHELADWMPKFGNVKKVSIQENGDSLVGDEIEIHDLLAEASNDDNKFFDDISASIRRRASDGKRYLHHVAYLGAIPPKIRDLKVFSDLELLCLADDGAAVNVDYRATKEAADASADQVSEALRRISERGSAGWALKDVLSALGELTTWATEMFINGAQIPETLLQQMKNFADKKATEHKEDSVEDAKLKEENDKLKADLADANKTIRASVRTALTQAMNGKIPKGKQKLVLTLADSLAEGQPIELADEDGTVTKHTPIELLRQIIEAIPVAVQPGQEDFGDDVADRQAIDLSKIRNKV